MSTTSGTERVPTSVLVLKDGEAWDLANVVEVVMTASEDAKTAGTLLRTFVLGVGNNVSTPMCGGIARARHTGVDRRRNYELARQASGVLGGAEGR